MPHEPPMMMWFVRSTVGGNPCYCIFLSLRACILCRTNRKPIFQMFSEIPKQYNCVQDGCRVTNFWQRFCLLGWMGRCSCTSIEERQMLRCAYVQFCICTETNASQFLISAADQSGLPCCWFECRWKQSFRFRLGGGQCCQVLDKESVDSKVLVHDINPIQK